MRSRSASLCEIAIYLKNMVSQARKSNAKATFFISDRITKKEGITIAGLMMFGRENSLPRMMLFDSKRCRAELMLGHEGEPSLKLYDRENTIRTALGNVKLKNTTGEIEDLKSTLVFFDEKGQVRWSAHKN